ncbi:MAG: mechanosensitive ion channel [Pseudomonadota bacterium]|jgi:small-conductance mechanosensitive channel
METEVPLFLGIRISTAGAGLLVLAMIAAAHFALRWYARRRVRQEEKTSPPAGSPRGRPLRHAVFVALLSLVGPVALVLWILGLHYVLTILVLDIGHPGLAQYGLPALDAVRGIGVILALMWLLSRIGRAVEARLVELSRRTRSHSDNFFLPIVGTAVRMLLPLLAIIMGSTMLAVPERLQVLFRNAVSMALIAAIAWVLYRLVDAACGLLLERYRIDVPDNREARAVHTQVTVLRKVAISVIVLFGFAAMLMVFEQVRQVGATILASAGVAGIVIGFAAQRSVGMVLAGFQIALTQPIRLDDVVIVEGEWGRIEEITLTYVVVNIWDQRRLVLPVTWFLERPFQNWTRTTSELLCTVELFVDHNMPLEALRAELTRLLESSKLWDRRVNILQVTDVREHTVMVRALMSASNSGHAWDLRCEVREGLLRFLQREHPESLPRLRVVRPAPAAQ